MPVQLITTDILMVSEKGIERRITLNPCKEQRGHFVEQFLISLIYFNSEFISGSCSI